MGLPASARVAALATSLALLLPAAVAAPAPAGRQGLATTPPDARGVTVDPNLLAQVAAAPAPAILSWDADEASRAEVVSFLEGTGIGYDAFEHIPGAVACVGSAEQVLRLSRAPGAISVWGEEHMAPALDTSVPAAFNGDPAAIWSGEGITGDGVGIAVVDTGIDATHPDLRYGTRTKANLRVIYSIHGTLGTRNPFCTVPHQYQEGLEDSETTSGHGTHLASVAAGDGSASGGKYRGVAPGADLMGLNVVETVTPDRHYNETNGVSLLRVAAAVDWIVGNLEGGAAIPKVALMGWDSPGLHESDHPLTLFLDLLEAYEVAVVMPTGNRGPGVSSCDRADTCNFNSLAAGGPISVGATFGSSRTALADFSSRGDPAPRQTGPSYDPRWTEYEPTLVAPGTNVTAARHLGLVSVGDLPSDHPLGASGSKSRSALDLTYHSLTGTSAAAAHVAGAIALMQEAALDAKGCFLSYAQVREILQQTATPMPGYAEWEVGAGMIDVTAAVWGARFAPKVGHRLNPWECPPAA